MNPAPELAARIARAREERAQAYAQWGTLAPAPIDIQLPSYPPWPTDRRNVLHLRTAHSSVLLTDGLSDPFADAAIDPEQQFNGLGYEMFVEVEGAIDPSAWTGSLPGKLLGQAATVTAALPDFEGMAQQMSQLVLPFYAGDILSPAYDNGGHIGFCLLGAPSATLPEAFTLHGQPVPMIGAKLIPVVDGVPATTKGMAGAEARKLVQRYRESGEFAYSPFKL